MAINRKIEGSMTVGSADALPLLAAAALKGAGETDESLRLLLAELLSDAVDKRRKEKQQKERLAEQAVRSAQEQAQITATRRANCSHRKLDNSSRLAGQYASDGRLFLVCQFCQEEFRKPAFEGEKPVPAELMPPADTIGG